MFKHHFFAVLLLFQLALIDTTVLGQKVDSSRIHGSMKNYLFVVPQYLIMDGIRLDYDRTLKNDFFRVGAGAMVFYPGGGGYAVKDFDRVTSLFGFGIMPNVKIQGYSSVKKNLGSGVSRLIIYIEFAPQFQYHRVEHETEVPQEFVENGITYYEFERGMVNSTVFRGGLNFNFGWQITLGRFVTDVYIGMGYRKSYIDPTSAPTSSGYYGFSPGWESILYTGFLVNAGVKFGIVF